VAACLWRHAPTFRPDAASNVRQKQRRQQVACGVSPPSPPQSNIHLPHPTIPHQAQDTPPMWRTAHWQQQHAKSVSSGLGGGGRSPALCRAVAAAPDTAPGARVQRNHGGPGAVRGRRPGGVGQQQQRAPWGHDERQGGDEGGDEEHPRYRPQQRRGPAEDESDWEGPHHQQQQYREERQQQAGRGPRDWQQQSPRDGHSQPGDRRPLQQQRYPPQQQQQFGRGGRSGGQYGRGGHGAGGAPSMHPQAARSPQAAPLPPPAPEDSGFPYLYGFGSLQRWHLPTGLAVTWLGTSSGNPTKDRNISCTLLRTPRSAFIVDCGEGSLAQLRKTPVDPALVEAIFVTHLHGDHCFGLASMIAAITHRRRRQIEREAKARAAAAADADGSGRGGGDEEGGGGASAQAAAGLRVYGPPGVAELLRAQMVLTGLQRDLALPLTIIEFVENEG